MFWWHSLNLRCLKECSVFREIYINCYRVERDVQSGEIVVFWRLFLFCTMSLSIGCFEQSLCNFIHSTSSHKRFRGLGIPLFWHVIETEFLWENTSRVPATSTSSDSFNLALDAQVPSNNQWHPSRKGNPSWSSWRAIPTIKALAFTMSC